MPCKPMLATSVALAMLAAALPAQSEEVPDPARELYLRYCGACHGPGGTGDGLAATFLRPKPPDLTRIAARNDGKFPYDRTMGTIDGTATMPAHGDPVMPVWGERFKLDAASPASRHAEARGKLLLITDHLQSIQVK